MKYSNDISEIEKEFSKLDQWEEAVNYISFIKTNNQKKWDELRYADPKVISSKNIDLNAEQQKYSQIYSYCLRCWGHLLNHKPNNLPDESWDRAIILSFMGYNPKEEKYNHFDYDYDRIKEYSDTLLPQEQINYLEYISTKVFMADTDAFKDNFDKILTLDGLLKFINEKKLNLMLKKDFNPYDLYVLGFDYKLIKEYKEHLKSSIYQMMYLEFIKKEVEDVIQDHKNYLAKKSGKSYDQSEYIQICRMAFLWGEYKKDQGAEEDYLQLEIKRIENLLETVERELNYLYKLQNLLEKDKDSTNISSISVTELNSRNNVQLKDSRNEMKVLKRFKRGELKKKCHKYAIEFELKKGETLTKEKIMKICKLLEEEGYEVIQGSVGSVLRDKLGYRKGKY